MGKTTRTRSLVELIDPQTTGETTKFSKLLHFKCRCLPTLSHYGSTRSNLNDSGLVNPSSRRHGNPTHQLPFHRFHKLDQRPVEVSGWHRSPAPLLAGRPRSGHGPRARGDHGQPVGRMGQRGDAVGRDLQLVWKRQIRQVEAVAAIARHLPRLRLVARPQHRSVSRRRGHRQGRTPGTGAEHGDLHRQARGQSVALPVRAPVGGRHVRSTGPEVVNPERARVARAVRAPLGGRHVRSTGPGAVSSPP